jgi:hypothetical protein
MITGNEFDNLEYSERLTTFNDEYLEYLDEQRFGYYGDCERINYYEYG